MSLTRLPFTLAAAVAFHVSATPPKKPDVHEKVTSERLESLLRTSTRIATLIRGIYWTGTLVEVVNTIASYIQSPNVPQICPLGLPLNAPTPQTLSTAFIAGSVLAVSGGLIRLMAYRTLGRFYTHDLGLCRGHALIANGPYSIVRHPGYSGLVMCTLGVLSIHLSSGSWVRESGVMGLTYVRVLVLVWTAAVGAISVSAVSRVNEEDRMMRDRFGAQWVEWAARVRYKLIPGVY
ncbi:hypothetical protein PAXRUDRAFT_26741 [Paxillus rubicundulus Ve08.2h10]|uniref:Protein-S-isoprenylcysteine O-methyltransferase n=1 Tax=Paxillus rubicundulus Ve08.2h10 TaxID=930991 RepID=A0A0D0DU36_9AGAM|nr:hypothetical protein PAXRUDRAFT_26741 [Paxillus rubicundulus Ve08.2h10]